MPLFELPKHIETEAFPAGSQVSFSKKKYLELTFETKQKENLSQVLGPFQPDQHIKFFTDGAWSMHQLVQHYLEQIGPAEVFLSTWTLTENPARVLHSLKEAGVITKLYGLFDYRIQDRSPKSFQMVSAICDKYKLTHCHAKAAVMFGDRYAVSIIGSANFSKNKRLEAGTIFTDLDSADFDRSWIQNKIEHESE